MKSNIKIIAGVLVVSFLLIGCGGGDESSNESKSDESSVQTGDIPAFPALPEDANE